MTYYVSRKIVQAWPLPKNGEEGYAVEYEDGYKSWCPKEAFEKANTALPDLTGKLEYPYQQRLIAEREQLAVDLERLQAFLGDEAYQELLPNEERNDLGNQAEAMQLLLSILDSRIARF